jgi:hypothetical protein
MSAGRFGVAEQLTATVSIRATAVSMAPALSVANVYRVQVLSVPIEVSFSSSMRVMRPSGARPSSASKPFVDRVVRHPRPPSSASSFVVRRALTTYAFVVTPLRVRVAVGPCDQ